MSSAPTSYAIFKQYLHTGWQPKIKSKGIKNINNNAANSNARDKTYLPKKKNFGISLALEKKNYHQCLLTAKFKVSKLT